MQSHVALSLLRLAVARRPGAGRPSMLRRRDFITPPAEPARHGCNWRQAAVKIVNRGATGCIQKGGRDERGGGVAEQVGGRRTSHVDRAQGQNRSCTWDVHRQCLSTAALLSPEPWIAPTTTELELLAVTLPSKHVGLLFHVKDLIVKGL